MAKDDLDFEVEGIDLESLDEPGRKMYDSLHGQFRKAYLKKTTSLADERKQRDAEAEKWRKQYEEAARELQKVNEWWTSEGQYYYNTPREAAAAGEIEDPAVLQRELMGLRQEMGRHVQGYDKRLTDLMQEMSTLSQGVRLVHDLFDLRFRHPEADPKRILEVAKERGLSDFDLAYNMAYGEENQKKKLDAEVEKARTEEREKLQTEQKLVETRPSTQRYAPPADAKSYSQASQGLLQSVRTGSGGGTLSD